MKQVKPKFPARMLALAAGLALSVGAFAQSTVKGSVKDASGEPIIGASVLINGTSNGTVTDLDGNFSLSVQPGQTLTISYIGYKKQQVTAQDNMVITMQDDAAQSLNEVVVIGYGVVKKKDLTGSVAALKPDGKNKGCCGQRLRTCSWVRWRCGYHQREWYAGRQVQHPHPWRLVPQRQQ